MPGNYRVILSDDARVAFLKIEGPIVDVIQKEIDSLRTMPNRFPIVDDTRSRRSPVRKLVIRPFLVYYHVRESKSLVKILQLFMVPGMFRREAHYFLAAHLKPRRIISLASGISKTAALWPRAL
jgi:hypothetical protein